MVLEQKVAEHAKHPIDQIRDPAGLHFLRKSFQERTRRTCGKQLYFYYESEALGEVDTKKV
jgi:hypothetical protein